jgi:hypothetical protein
MDFPLVSIVSVVASCVRIDSCPWWNDDAGPSWLFIIGFLIVIAALVGQLRRT